MPSPPLCGLFDLSRVRTILVELPAYGDLVKFIDQYSHNLSVIEDLRAAIATLNTLLTMGPGGPEAPMQEGEDLIRQSLFVSTVMLYSRATHSQDSGRPFKGGVLKAYSPELRAAHDRLLHLRDKVVAHHGAAADQNWTDDRLIMCLAEGVVSYRSVFDRKLMTREALEDLRALLPVCVAHVRARASKIEGELNDLVQDLMHTDPAVWDAVAASPFDPVAYFGAGGLAQAIEAGGEPGDVSGQIQWTRTS
jgi:hypothetical protein